MARNISDLALFADVMMDSDSDSIRQAAGEPKKPSRIAISDNLGITSISDEVLTPFHRFIDELEKTGCAISEHHPNLSGVHDAFDVLRAHSYAISLEQTLVDNPGIIKPEVVWNIETGVSLSAEKIRQATRSQGQIINRAAEFIRQFDLLICPATCVASIDTELRYPGSDGSVPIPEYYRWLAIAYATTVTALPIITLPCGFKAAGMPIGIQLVGKPGGEDDLFRYARFIEKITGWNSMPINPLNF